MSLEYSTFPTKTTRLTVKNIFIQIGISIYCHIKDVVRPNCQCIFSKMAYSNKLLIKRAKSMGEGLFLRWQFVRVIVDSNY